MPNEIEVHLGPQFFQWVAEVKRVCRLMIAQSDFGIFGSHIDDSFPDR